MSALKILVIPGSLRTGSLNARLAAAAAYELAQADAEVTRIHARQRLRDWRHHRIGELHEWRTRREGCEGIADQAYDDMDRLKHPGDIEALNALVRQLIDVSQRMM